MRRTTARRPDALGVASMCNGMISTSACSIRRLASRTPAKTLALLTAAHRLGPSVGTVVDHIHHHDGAGGVRRILGVLALAKKHGPAVVEDAAKAALDLAVPTYRFIRRYLERRPPVPLTLRQVDPLIRQLSLYRDLIDRTTGDSE